MSSNTWFCIDCRVPMQTRDGFQKCPICGAEVWFPEGDDRALPMSYAQTTPVSRSYVPGTCAPGGSDPVGCTKKEKMHKPSCQQEYSRLFKQV